VADPPPDTATPRIEDPADMLRDALALMDNGERNYPARERVGLYLVALRESGCALVRSDELGRLRAENVRAQKGPAALQAGLRHIADGQECTTYMSPSTCRTSGRARDGVPGADRWWEAAAPDGDVVQEAEGWVQLVRQDLESIPPPAPSSTEAALLTWLLVALDHLDRIAATGGHR